jgi:2-oxoglutarate dehydrogenase E1 component
VGELDFVTRANQEYVDDLYRRYLADPAAVDARWALFFAGFDLAQGPGGNGRPPAPRVARAAAAAPGGGNGSALAPSPIESVTDAELAAQTRRTGYIPGIYDLVHSFRAFGHFIAKLDPLGGNAEENPHLTEALARFRPDDMSRVIEGAGGFKGATDPTLGELIARLKTTYCGTFAVQYLHLPQKEHQRWLQAEMGATLNHPVLAREERLEILKSLIAAEEFEQFLHAKYVGHKRFSLEGADALIPLLETAIEGAAAIGVRELIMCMAHRGRLNVLAHTLRKPYDVIMAEFEGAPLPSDVKGDGDVKYHQGFSHDHTTRGGAALHLSLSPNPSHLELVDPVQEGIVRGKQDRTGDRERRRVLSLQIHGDAAFSGQGLVPETLSLSELEHYDTGGTIHIVVDNQVGFTASPHDYRCTPYASDVAGIIHAPVFHVNGDDPEAAVWAARLALGYRDRFRRDAVIDLKCYRRHGHNEVDDPSFTQPLMYEKIAKHPTTRRLYEERLIADGAITREEADRLAAEARGRLEAALLAARAHRPRQAVLTLGGAWEGLERAGADWSAETAVPRATLERIAAACARVPEGFSAHPKLKRLLEARARALEPGARIDWATAEMLAFGSLVLEGTKVRLAGQDSRRGTFSQRHAAWRDVKTDEAYVPLDHIDEAQARFVVIDSMLSEAAVLGFEYGYSWADPWTLTLWEAQFGDFANMAQAIIDVFIAAAESKWQRMSGLVLLLPHGYEGQGPEHSSARLERFLQLCGDDNIQVANLTTPAQYFHALRRQMRRKFRKPLVLMTPKSLLRHELAVSSGTDLAEARFARVLDDPAVADRAAVRRVLLCSGKVYYTLVKAREARQRADVAIVRVEELHPLPAQEIGAIVESYARAGEVFWVQEEPWNMGAWNYVEANRRSLTFVARRGLRYVGRKRAASTATGSSKMHQAEEDALVESAFAPAGGE